MALIRIALTALLLALIVVTAVSATDSDMALVRIWDFPRVQIAVLLVVTYLALAVLMKDRRRALLGLGLLTAIALIYQLWRLWPYVAPHAVEGSAVAICPAADRVSVLVANVKYDNTDTAPLVALVERTRPDLVLLLETTGQWGTALVPLGTLYPHRIAEPRPDGHGMHLFSRLPFERPAVRVLLEGERPSIWTGVRLRSGQTIGFVGLHPAPPPLSDTTRRDAVFMLTAKSVRSSATPAIVAGDLNNVSWSKTAQLFKRVGGLADPRVGRGLMPTFNARWPLLRWPLDHVYHTEHFAVVAAAAGDDFGSDHFPYFTTLCRVPPRVRLPVATPSEVIRAERLIAAARRTLAPVDAPASAPSP